VDEDEDADADEDEDEDGGADGNEVVLSALLLALEVWGACVVAGAAAGVEAVVVLVVVLVVWLAVSGVDRLKEGEDDDDDDDDDGTGRRCGDGGGTIGADMAAPCKRGTQ
jgi:hypothetical protein